MTYTTRCVAGRGRETPRLLAWLAAFAAAFGYVEGAAAHYLRMHLYPQGFGDSTLLVVDAHTLAIEVGRELCTLIVIAATAALTSPPLVRRVASFVYIFGVWDLGYYASLWLFEGWPSSVYDWDLLFLIPAPWFAPVLAPMAISAIGIVWAVSVHVIADRRGDVAVPWHGLTLVHVALIAWQISFMIHDSPQTRLPSHYRWWLFLLGAAAAGGGLLATWLSNGSSPVAVERESKSTGEP